MLITLAPVLLGQGEPLLHALDLPALGFCVTDRKASEYATHFMLEKVAIQKRIDQLWLDKESISYETRII